MLLIIFNGAFPTISFYLIEFFNCSRMIRLFFNLTKGWIISGKKKCFKKGG